MGADGLIRATAGNEQADVTMELWNADGGRAEISGNGLRCLARALVDAGVVAAPGMTIATDAGLRRAVVDPDGTVAVEMGTGHIRSDGVMDLGEERIRDHRFVEMGNPHLVLAVKDVDELEVEEIGSAAQRLDRRGINVEFVELGPAPDELTMRVWERGVGETQACGTGACAAAIAFRDLKEVGDRVTVHQSGGDAIVDLSGGAATLTGPAEFVATVEVPWL